MRSEPIKDFDSYHVWEDGTVRNKRNQLVKPDKGGCVCVREQTRRKTLSIARLVAISFLDMPDDKQHRAYKKDPSKGFGIDNIAWDSICEMNKDRLIKARECKRTNLNETDERLKQEVMNELKQVLMNELKESMKQQLEKMKQVLMNELKESMKQQEQQQLEEMKRSLKQQQEDMNQKIVKDLKEMKQVMNYDDDEYDEADDNVW